MPGTDRLTFARPQNGRLQIGPGALTTMCRFVQDAPHKLEAGGVLLGRHILDTNDIVVDMVTTPMLGDRSSRLQYFRARRRHQERIDQVWHESAGTCTYLGEWHTHPERFPKSSLVDRADWRRKLLVDRFSLFMFFIIVGTDAVAVWEGHLGRFRLWSLRAIG